MFSKLSSFVKTMIGVSALASVSTVLSACYGPPPQLNCPTERFACSDYGNESILWRCLGTEETSESCSDQGMKCSVSDDGAFGQCVPVESVQDNQEQTQDQLPDL